MNKLLKLIKRKDNFFANSKQVIEHAFTVGGIDYYQHTDVANMPYKRALKCISVYNELSMKCDRNYLNAHVEAMESIMKKGGSSLNLLFEIKQLNNQLKERLLWIYDEDLIYKIAAVRFFDKNENPEDFDWVYAQKKIKHWKQHEQAASFFLREPIKRLIPFLNEQNLNLKSYSEVQKAQDKTHRENLSTNLSESRKEELLNSTDNLFWEEKLRASTL